MLFVIQEYFFFMKIRSRSETNSKKAIAISTRSSAIKLREAGLISPAGSLICKNNRKQPGMTITSTIIAVIRYPALFDFLSAGNLSNAFATRSP